LILVDAASIRKAKSYPAFTFDVSFPAQGRTSLNFALRMYFYQAAMPLISEELF
jgi:hypothetical protein